MWADAVVQCVVRAPTRVGAHVARSWLRRIGRHVSGWGRHVLALHGIRLSMRPVSHVDGWGGEGVGGLRWTLCAAPPHRDACRVVPMSARVVLTPLVAPRLQIARLLGSSNCSLFAMELCDDNERLRKVCEGRMDGRLDGGLYWVPQASRSENRVKSQQKMKMVAGSMCALGALGLGGGRSSETRVEITGMHAKGVTCSLMGFLHNLDKSCAGADLFEPRVLFESGGTWASVSGLREAEGCAHDESSISLSEVRVMKGGMGL